MGITVQELNQRRQEIGYREFELDIPGNQLIADLDYILRPGEVISTAKTDLAAPHLYAQLKSYAKTEELRCALKNPKLARLAYLRQVGILTNPLDLPDNSFSSPSLQRISHHPGLHLFDQRRLTHVLIVASDMYVSAGRLGYGYDMQSKAAAAGLQHDTGHAILSHVGDEIVDDITQTSHEERSINTLEKPYYSLLNRIPNYGPYNMFGTAITQEEVREFLKPQADIILEKPGLGQILKLVDTNAYLQVDLREAGLDLGLQSIIPAIGEHITLNEEGILAVDQIGRDAILHLLNVRRESYGRLYTHPFSLIAEAMHVKGIKRLLDQGEITVHDLETGTDDFIYGALENHSRHDKVSANLFSGFHQGIQVPGSLGQYIPIDSLPLSEISADEVNHTVLEQRVGNYLGLPNEDLVVVIPPDIGRKKILIADNNTGECEELQATDNRTYNPLQGHVIVSCRPDIANQINQRKRKKAGFTLQ